MNSLLAYIQFIFIGLVIYGSVLTFGNISINTSMSGILAPTLAWFAGTGLRASFNSDNNQTKCSIFMAVIILALSFLWINSTGYWYNAHAIEISGKNLLFISFFIGFLGTTKSISDINSKS
jgi:L-lactate permease